MSAQLCRTVLLMFLAFHCGVVMSQVVWDRVEHRYADSNGVKIHYAALGQGKLGAFRWHSEAGSH